MHICFYLRLRVYCQRRSKAENIRNSSRQTNTTDERVCRANGQTNHRDRAKGSRDCETTAETQGDCAVLVQGTDEIRFPRPGFSEPRKSWITPCRPCRGFR